MHTPNKHRRIHTDHSDPSQTLPKDWTGRREYSQKHSMKSPLSWYWNQTKISPKKKKKRKLQVNIFDDYSCKHSQDIIKLQTGRKYLLMMQIAHGTTKHRPIQKMGTRPKETFLQRRHTDVQRRHKTMLNIAEYQRNANLNYSEVELPWWSSGWLHLPTRGVQVWPLVED